MMLNVVNVFGLLVACLVVRTSVADELKKINACQAFIYDDHPNQKKCSNYIFSTVKCIECVQDIGANFYFHCKGRHCKAYYQGKNYERIMKNFVGSSMRNMNEQNKVNLETKIGKRIYNSQYYRKKRRNKGSSQAAGGSDNTQRFQGNQVPSYPYAHQGVGMQPGEQATAGWLEGSFNYSLLPVHSQLFPLRSNDTNLGSTEQQENNLSEMFRQHGAEDQFSLLGPQIISRQQAFPDTPENIFAAFQGNEEQEYEESAQRSGMQPGQATSSADQGWGTYEEGPVEMIDNVGAECQAFWDVQN